MNATKGNVVTIRYALQVEGELIDQRELDYLHGNRNIVVGLEEALEGKAVGERVQVAVFPEKGYGLYDPDSIQVIERSSFPAGTDFTEGAMFYSEDPDGNPMPFTILNVEGDNVTIDFNHTLAGETLNFDVTITGIRAASQDELAHGHAHGIQGHT